MCEQGVSQLLAKLQAADLNDYTAGDWSGIADGFGRRNGAPGMILERCKACEQLMPVVKRDLESGGYNLPDAAVYQRIENDAPCVALGMVVAGKTTASRRPDANIRRRWQGMLWDVYRVAFIDVENGRLGRYEPSKEWTQSSRLSELSSTVESIRTSLLKARSEGKIPVINQGGQGDSRATEVAVEEVLTPALRENGFRFLGMDRSAPIIPAFWWGHYLDLLYSKPGDGTLAIEIKVTEDWEHPVNEPLGDLLAHNAVVNIRIPTHRDPFDDSVRNVVSKAEHMLEETGRVAFLQIG